MRAVRPEPSPAVLRLIFAAGIPEVSRFSCMKFLDVSGVFDYAGLSRNSRYRSCSYCLPRITRTSASGLHLFEIASFRSSIAHPAYTPIYASLTPSRESAQDSGPSGSLVLSRKNFAFSASCRFYPGAFCNGDVTTIGFARGLTFTARFPTGEFLRDGERRRRRQQRWRARRSPATHASEIPALVGP